MPGVGTTEAAAGLVAFLLLANTTNQKIALTKNNAGFLMGFWWFDFGALLLSTSGKQENWQRHHRTVEGKLAKTG